MVMPWEMSASHVQAGELGRLLIVDPSNASEGRAVRILPGNSAQHSADSTLEGVLDDQDLANATAIMLVPRMREVRAELVQWAAHLGGGQQGSIGVADGGLTGGGWDAACWRSAEDVVARLPPSPDAPRSVARPARRPRPSFLNSIALETGHGIRL